MAAVHPWAQNQGFDLGRVRGQEGNSVYRIFDAWLQIGPGRSMEDLQRISGLKARTCSTYASRYRWRERAEAYDLWKAGHEALVHVVSQPLPGDEDRTSPVTKAALEDFCRRNRAYQAEYQAKLRDYRSRMEELGRMQTRAARNLMVLASTGLAQHHRYSELREDARAKAEKPYFAPVRITDMMRTANAMSGSGAELEARALGIDQLMAQIHSIAQVDDWLNQAGDVTEAEILEILPPDLRDLAGEELLDLQEQA